MSESPITIKTTVNAPAKKAWEFWSNPEHIKRWNNASPEWHTPHAENDLREGGRFKARMEAKDGSVGFDFGGQYTKVVEPKEIAYRLDDGRNVTVTFTPDGDSTEIVETFEPEKTNPPDFQKQGWQAILDNFKNYTESKTAALKEISFEKIIDAPTREVYDKMLNLESYREWTSVFNGDSTYKGSWDKGSKILFVGVDKDGKEGGMVSRIDENIPGEFVSIEHLGIVEDGREITDGPKVEGWAGIKEEYFFKDENGKTKLVASMGCTDEFKEYFENTWPKALDKLKEICER